MPIDLTLILVALIGSVSSVAAFLNSLNARRKVNDQRELIASKVDSEAYKLAQSLYNEMLNRAKEERLDLERRIVELEQKLDQVESELREAETSLAREITRSQFLEITVADLRLEVKYLKQKLQLREVSFPGENDDSSEDLDE